MRRDHRQGRAPDDARGRRRPALPGGLTASSTRVELRDGSLVIVRPIEPGDKAAILAIYQGLSEQSRYQRFMTAVGEPSASDLRYLTEVDHTDHEALLAIDADSGAATVVGRPVREEGGDSAEAAIAVIDAWQGRGLGMALSQLLAERARELGRAALRGPAARHERADARRARRARPRQRALARAATIQVEVEIPDVGIGEHMAGVLRVAAGGTVEIATPPGAFAYRWRIG